MTVVNYSITNTVDDVAYGSVVGGLLDTALAYGETGAGTIHGGVRFRSVAVDQGAAVATATLTVKEANPTSGTVWGVLYGVDADTAPLWTATNPPAASLTSASTPIFDGATQVYDVTAIVQEIVDRAGWASGANMAFVFVPTGADGLIEVYDYGASPANAAALSIDWTPGGPPTLADLTLTPAAVSVERTAGHVVGALSGMTPGSTLSLQDDAGGLFALDGTNIEVDGTLTAGIHAITVRETLTGATNTPNDTVINIAVAPKGMSFVTSVTGVNTADITGLTQAGDHITAWAYRDGNATAPSLPSGQGWDSEAFSGANTNSGRLATKIATGAAEGVGTFTNATSLCIVIYRPEPNFVLSTGAVSSAGGAGSGTQVTYPALTLEEDDCTSIVLGVGGHRSTNTNLQDPPAGMVNRATVQDATDEAAIHATTAGVPAWAAAGGGSGAGTSSGWRSYTLEIKATYVPPPAGSPRSRSWIVD